MCFGQSNKVAKASLTLQQQQADEAAQDEADQKAQEAQRQQNITAGNSAIDSAFSNFNDGYYNDYTKNYTDYYTPQLTDQYNQSKTDLTNSLADKGLTQSSIAATLFGRLQKQNDTAQLQIGSQGADAARTLQQNVEKGKNDLYSLNQSAADPSAISNRAASQATALVAPVSYAPLGDVFSSALGDAGTFLKANQTSANPIGGSSGTSIFGASKTGSGKVTV